MTGREGDSGGAAHQMVGAARRNSEPGEERGRTVERTEEMVESKNSCALINRQSTNIAYFLNICDSLKNDQATQRKAEITTHRSRSGLKRGLDGGEVSEPAGAAAVHRPAQRVRRRHRDPETEVTVRSGHGQGRSRSGHVTNQVRLTSETRSSTWVSVQRQERTSSRHSCRNRRPIARRLVSGTGCCIFIGDNHRDGASAIVHPFCLSLI